LASGSIGNFLTLTFYAKKISKNVLIQQRISR